jgi:beta-glucosidase
VLGVAALVAVALGTPTPSARADEHCPWVGSTRPRAERVAQLMERMTTADRVRMVSGIGLEAAPFGGVIPVNARLCIPALELADGPAGVANGFADVTQLPAPIAAAATWDPDLVERYGEIIGREARGKGIDVNLGPTVNIVRDPRWGRTFETYGEDPYLSGRMGVAYVEGVQGQGTMAMVKHYAVYNQETNRNVAVGDAVVSERALREVYLPHFDVIVDEAAPASVMCSYATVNGEHACQNPLLLETLKSEWAFPGFVTSDWYAAQSVDAAAAGLDVEMPAGFSLGTPLEQALARGAFPRLRLDDMVRRILTQMFRFGMFDGPDPGQQAAMVTSAVHAGIARDVAAQATVLLKNDDAVLPLDSSTVDSVAVIGAAAGPGALTRGGGSSQVDPPYVVTPLEGIAERAQASAVAVEYAADGPDAVALAAQSDVAVVFAALHETELADLSTIDLAEEVDRLIAAVAAVNPRTIVVLNTGSPVTMPWVDEVAAVIEAWYPGQEYGSAIASVLFGDVDPGGRLPVTFPRSLDDVPASGPEHWPGTDRGVEYAEGVFVGYRWYDARGVDPLFPFGAGLSYTTFAFDDLRVRSEGATATVEVNVSNIGARAGSEVAQLYVGYPDRSDAPPRQLRGFERVELEPGETARVTFRLDEGAFARWDEQAHDWMVDPGDYRIMVGSSSADLPLEARLHLP